MIITISEFEMNVTTPFSAKNAAGLVRANKLIKLSPGESIHLCTDDILVLDITDISKYAYIFDNHNRETSFLVQKATESLNEFRTPPVVVDGATVTKPRLPVSSSPTSADFLQEPDIANLPPTHKCPKPTPRRLDIDQVKEDSTKKQKSTPSSTTKNSLIKNKSPSKCWQNTDESSSSKSPTKCWPVPGNMVHVEIRTGPGLNQGGIAKVEKVHADGTVDVKYPVNGGCEKCVLRSRLSPFETEHRRRPTFSTSPKQEDNKENRSIKRSATKKNTKECPSSQEKKKKKIATASVNQRGTTLKIKEPPTSLLSSEQEPRKKRKIESIVVEPSATKTPVGNPEKKQWHPSICNRTKALIKDDADHGFVAEVFAAQCIIRDEAVRPQVLDAAWRALIRASDPRLIDSLMSCLEIGFDSTREPWLPPDELDANVQRIISSLLRMITTDAEEAAWALGAKTAALNFITSKIDLSSLDINGAFLNDLTSAVLVVFQENFTNDDDEEEQLAETRLFGARLALAQLISGIFQACGQIDHIAKSLGKGLKTNAILLADALAIVHPNSLHCQAKLLNAAKHPAAARREALATQTQVKIIGRTSPLDSLINALINDCAH